MHYTVELDIEEYNGEDVLLGIREHDAIYRAVYRTFPNTCNLPIVANVGGRMVLPDPALSVPSLTIVIPRFMKGTLSEDIPSEDAEIQICKTEAAREVLGK